ncbi:unnamed protein product, partial [Mesorhabditis belari]|uniref:Uncharacterized protein n=1 Tax=Mesorhabditis belari TaxID=2138241 RepID=A0AAF3F960_9BILA
MLPSSTDEPIDYFLGTIFNECNEIVSVDKRADVWLQIERCRKGDDGEFCEELEVVETEFAELHSYTLSKRIHLKDELGETQEMRLPGKQIRPRRRTEEGIFSQAGH